MNICVYGASSTELDKEYSDKVEELGKEMAKRGHGLVFGGGAQGLMGAAVRGVSSENGYSLGVAPTFFDKPGILFEGCSEFIFTETMRERKEIMENRSDAFVMLPGGIGTFEEFFEVLSAKQLAQMDKPIAIFNINGYYDSLIEMINEAVAKGFIKESCLGLYGVFDNAAAMLDYIEAE